MPLELLFFLTALLYSCVGFGGGSTYIALLALFGFPYHQLAVVSLICNITVVSVSSMNYLRRGYTIGKNLWPLFFISAPLSFLGGLIRLKEKEYLFILGSLLIVSSLRLFQSLNKKDLKIKHISQTKACVMGGVIGLLSGMVGIGGGIFLAPILLTFSLSSPKLCASVCAFFILINSMAGLIGQFLKNSYGWDLVMNNAGLIGACLAGSMTGSALGASKYLSSKVIHALIALLIFYVGTRIFFTNL